MQMAEIIEFPTDLNISNRLNLFEIMNESVIFKFWKKTDSERIKKYEKPLTQLIPWIRIGNENYCFITPK